MATAAGSSQIEGPSQDKIDVLKELLYNGCMDAAGPSHAFSQQDLLQLGVIEGNNLNMLLQVIQRLTKERLFKAVTSGNQQLGFSWRSRDDAKKYANLTAEQAMIYELIDNAGADGIWSRGLRTRTGMIDSVVNKRLKELEQKGLIRDMKSIENPTKKMYIKASLRPSERATGGAWYTDSALDQIFIGALEKHIFDFVRTRSTYLSKHSGGGENAHVKVPKKGVLKGDSETVQSKKRSADALSTDDKGKAGTTARPAKRSRNMTLLPLPAGYNDYPTARQCAEHIDKKKVAKNVALSEADIQQLVDVLVYDGILEPMPLPHHRGTGYRICEIPRADPTSLGEIYAEWKEKGQAGEPFEDVDIGAPDVENGLTEAPCGRCPVFDLCEEGGPVNPGNCVYFNRWLGLEEP